MNLIRIASLSPLPVQDETPEEAMATVTRMIDDTCVEPTDLICLPEIFAWVTLTGEKKIQAAQTVTGPVCQQLALLAKKYSVYILAPILERDGQKVYNSALLFDRQGNITGKYRKVVLPDYEVEKDGISPGPSDFDCFQTEFGPIGCAICFDLNYQDIISRIQGQGCKLVLFPTMFQGIFLMRTWAQLYGLYFVSSANELYSTAVDPLGRVITQPWEHDRIMRLMVNLDYVILHTDHNEEKIRTARHAYPGQVDIDVTYLEGGVIFSSLHPTKTASEIAKEFGIETLQEYTQRSRQICLDHLKNS